MKLPKYAFDVRLRTDEICVDKQKKREAMGKEVEDFITKYVLSEMATYIEHAMNKTQYSVKYDINFESRFMESGHSTISYIIYEIRIYSETFKTAANNAIRRIRNTLVYRGYEFTYNYHDHKLICNISWRTSKKTNRTLRAICRCIIVFSRYREDYYKPGGKGMITCKRNFESMLTN